MEGDIVRSKAICCFIFVFYSFSAWTAESSDPYSGYTSLNSSSDSLPTQSTDSLITPLALDKILMGKGSSSAPSSPKLTRLGSASPKIQNKESPRSARGVSLFKSLLSPRRKSKEILQDEDPVLAAYMTLLHRTSDICTSIEIASDTIILCACKYREKVNLLVTATEIAEKEKIKSGKEVYLNELSQSMRQNQQLLAMLTEINAEIITAEEALVRANKQE